MEISVVMSVYNTEGKFLRDSIDSILGQTFKEFEFIIINDGSGRETTQIIESYDDSRIIKINNPQNMGLTRSLNKGLAVASGKYIARMDADDISYKQRLEKQYVYMEKHEEVDILGAWTSDGENIQKYDGKISSEVRKVRMIFGNAGISHPTAFMRTSFLKENAIQYDEAIEKAQDYKLWVDCLKAGGKISVYPQSLLFYRIHENQISSAGNAQQRHYARLIQRELLKELYEQITEKEIEQIFRKETLILTKAELQSLFDNLEKSNRMKRIYSKKALHYELTYLKECLLRKKSFDPGYLLYRMQRYYAKRH